MGIWIDAFMAPREELPLPPEAFAALVLDLARERLVRMPWTLVAGELCVNASAHWVGAPGRANMERAAVGSVLRTPEADAPEEFWEDDDPPPWGPSFEVARVLARGDAVLDVLPALRAAPYGREDVAVAFRCLDFRNHRLLDDMGFEDTRTTLVCFALAAPQRRPLAANDTARPGGPSHPVRTCVVHTYKHSRLRPVPAITSVVARHFGPDLVTGMTWG